MSHKFKARFTEGCCCCCCSCCYYYAWLLTLPVGTLLRGCRDVIRIRPMGRIPLKQFEYSNISMEGNVSSFVSIRF